MTEPKYRLVVRQGPNPGQIYELNKPEVGIGRDIANDVVINDAEVSRRHARMTLESGRYTIEDFNSTNGTYVDGQRLIGPHVMAAGETVMFGDNIGMVFEGEPSLPDLTVPSVTDIGRTPVSAIPIPQESYPASPAVQKPQVYRGPAPKPRVEMAVPVEETERKPINSWLLAGSGCLLVILVLVIALMVFIDQPWKPGGGLYCVSPFDIIFSAFGYCH